tara:strand:- start:10912 stop:12699 length:1788 start_codon:yes stop_codon:yes gene_type:complete
MPGERKGKTYEALVMVALKELKRKGKLKGEIFWNKTPNGMSIEIDFSVGPNQDKPKFIILVTHSSSAKNSDMKCWRNLGELAEAKVCLSVIPKVFSIVFDSAIRESLKSLQASAFDGQIVIGDKKYGRQIQNWVDKNLTELPTDSKIKADEIQNRIRTDPALKKLCNQLVSDLGKLLKSRTTDLELLWKMERRRRKPQPKNSRETFVRRGISKLLIFEDRQQAIQFYRGKRTRINEIPNYAFTLGLAIKGISGPGNPGWAKPADSEIVNAVKLLDDLSLEAILRSAPEGSLEDWLITLRNSDHLVFMGQYVMSEYHNLCKPNTLHKRFISLHKNPWALVKKGDAPSNWPPRSVWLLEFLVEFIKVSTGLSNGYGHAQLAKDVVSGGWGQKKDLISAGQFGGGFGLSAWIARNPDSTFRQGLIKGMAHAISKRLNLIPATQTQEIIHCIQHKVNKNIIEAKLCTHQAFKPLYVLIRNLFPDCQKEGIRTAYAEKANLVGQAGKTTIVKEKNTIINWQSVSDAGRDHKKKELCGRALALRYSWDAENKKFITRPGVKKLILIIDGTFRQKDLNALVNAGWDHIFYPDEMDELVKEIV